jgi:hypothetical protein
MREYLFRASSILLGGVALLSCDKATVPTPDSTAYQRQHVMVQRVPEGTATKPQQAWLAFVDQVERGEQKDPAGQYVAKGTKGVVDASGQRIRRPKFDAATAAFAQHYVLQKTSAQGAPTGGDDGQYIIQPCPREGCGGEGGSPVTSTFISSENQGGSGAIHDLKLIQGNGNTTSAQRVLNAGYIKLNADLNKGAGGDYIYLAFTRTPAYVLSGREYYQNQLYSSPTDFVTSVETENGSFWGPPSASYNFFDVWLPNQNTYNFWVPLDLNAGAGGNYIYSFQTKQPSSPPFQEIGILSGNSSSIQPPSNWHKHDADLNEGAGGNYIYLCYKL